MKSSNLFAMLFASLFVGVGLTSCSQSEDTIGGADTRAVAVVEVTIPAGVISDANLHWTSDKVWKLNGKVAVPVGKTLTIDAGTKVIGVTKSKPVDASALIVPRGAKIEAVGTASNPIIMTAENGTKGGWGGIVLLGNAPINQSGDVYIEGINEENLPDELKNVDFRYGGTNATDNSGILQYVRVEYAGASIATDNELNAFTFGGVGRGTTLDHLQAYYGADDAFEFFGGTVNAKYLVSTATDDDAFDFDFGYTGSIQFALATIDASMSYSKDPNGIECDNDGKSSTATPFTHPVLSNLTIRGTVNGQVAGIAGGGTALKSGADFRRNCEFTLVNSILYGFPRGILRETTQSHSLENNVVVAAPAGSGINFSTSASGTGTFTPSSTNYGLTSYDDIVLSDPWGGYKDSSLVPSFDPAYSGATNVAGIVSVDYKGAFDPAASSLWTSGTWVK